MIEKLKPYQQVPSYTTTTENDRIEVAMIDVPLTEADHKINEIIDIVNLLLTPQESTTNKTVPLSESPKKRTAREIVEAIMGEWEKTEWDDLDERNGYHDALEAVIKAFDREGIE